MCDSLVSGTPYRYNAAQKIPIVVISRAKILNCQTSFGMSLNKANAMPNVTKFDPNVNAFL